jgi:hypothetical protein
MKSRDFLSWLALGAALVLTASAEYGLAVACGASRAVAAALPVALDVYSVRALRAHREVATSVGALIAVNAVAHLVSAHFLAASVPVVIGVSALGPLVLWRVHALRVPAPAIAPFEAVPVSAPVESPTAPQTPAGGFPPPIVVDCAPVALHVVPDATDCADPLLSDARRLDVEIRTRTGKGASLRTLQAELRIGQARAQRIRAALAEVAA